MMAGQRLPFAPWRICLHRKQMLPCALYNSRLSSSPPRDERHPPQSRRWSQYCHPCVLPGSLLFSPVGLRDLLSSALDLSKNFFVPFKRAEPKMERLHTMISSSREERLWRWVPRR
jgi:hypothetical protein